MMLWNHNTNEPIGRAVRAEERGDHALVVNRFANFDAVPKAKATYSMLKDNLVPGWSFHFVQATAIPHPSVRGALRYTKAHMVETCPVVAPSIPGAVTAGIRSAIPRFDLRRGDLLDARARGDPAAPRAAPRTEPSGADRGLARRAPGPPL